MPSLDASIFRDYDIRGIVGETLHITDAYAIGRAFASVVKSGHIVVGRDGRLTSPELSAALITGLIDGGLDVTDIGLVPTPQLYFADRSLSADAAIQVTGSHNPASHNGFKFLLHHRPFFGAAIKDLAARIASPLATNSARGQINVQDTRKDYIDALVSAAPDSIPLRVVWDCANGAMGERVAEFIPYLSGQHYLYNSTIDGNFPNHHPDPSGAVMQAFMAAKIKEHHADLCFGFDGDGDRLGVMDARGRFVSGDLLTAYLSSAVLSRHRGAAVIFDVKSSLAALDIVTARGGKPVLYKTGHSHIKSRMLDLSSPLGGEMSGHIFIKDNHPGYDDGLFSAVRVLSQAAKGDSLAAFMDKLPPHFPTDEIRLFCPDSEKFALMARLTLRIKSDPDFADANILSIDGLRISNDLGWFLIRASNTGAELVLRIEGRDAVSRDILIEKARSLLFECGFIWRI